MSKLAKKVVPGVKISDLNTLAIELVKKEGDVPAFLNYRPDGARRKYPAALCVSINEEIVHGIPNEGRRVVKEGDIVSIDLGLSHKRMITDMAVTVGAGKSNEENNRLIKATKEALSAGIKAAKAGKFTGDIGFAIEKIARKYRFSIAEGLSGHGVGFSIHEDPYVPNFGTPGYGEVLKEGMVLAIEPMFCLGSGEIVSDKDGLVFKTKDGETSAHFEHTIAITKKGPIILTKE